MRKDIPDRVYSYDLSVAYYNTYNHINPNFYHGIMVYFNSKEIKNESGNYTEITVLKIENYAWNVTFSLDKVWAQFSYGTEFGGAFYAANYLKNFTNNGYNRYIKYYDNDFDNNLSFGDKIVYIKRKYIGLDNITYDYDVLGMSLFFYDSVRKIMFDIVIRS